MATILDRISALLRTHNGAIQQAQAQIANLQQVVTDLSSRPRSVEEEIDALPGRRIESRLSGEVTFDLTNLGNRGTPIILPVSQDGPFVMTHYPMVLWRPSAPANATNLGRWRPISSFPLPTQQVTTDIIDIEYELADGGNQRNFQNAPSGPLLSRPDCLLPCPVPTLWSPNSTISFTPLYLAITFSGSPVAPTQGIIHVDIPGYRIVNM